MKIISLALILILMHTNTDAQTMKESGPLACKLTSEELRVRKETVLASLKNKIKDTKELPAGYAYTFEASDTIIDEITEFIKTERACCDFFNFKLIVEGTQNIFLEITGPKGAKDFIHTELGL